MIPLKYQDNSDLLIKTKNRFWRDFICGPVVKNPPANAGDMGLIPGLGKFHMPVEQLISPCATTTENECQDS